MLNFAANYEIYSSKKRLCREKNKLPYAQHLSLFVVPISRSDYH